MLPLRPANSWSRRRKLLIAFGLSLWLLGEIILNLSSGERSDLLYGFAYHPDRSFISFFTSIVFFQNTFAFLLNTLFAWVFIGVIFSHGIRATILFITSFVAIFLSAKFFYLIHPYLEIPITLADAWLGFFLGAVMRVDVWGQVDTLVVGPGIFRVYRVPSYVLLFFWFFYLMIGNFFLVDPFSNLPMLYWLPFSAFIQGFLAQTVIQIAQRRLGTNS